MIEQVTINEYAIIKELEIKLHPGFTVITGETGSGKSILLEALAVSLGSKADRIMVRNGADRAIMETTISGKTIRRLLSNKGHTKSFYNDEPITLNELRKHTSQFVDFHGQNDQQLILNIQNHIYYLDNFCGIEKMVTKIQELYQELIETRSKLSKLQEDSIDRQNRLDLLNFQLEEIDSISPKINEDIDINRQYRKLSKLGDIQKKLREIYQLLIEGDHAVLDVVHQSLREVESLSKYDEDLNNIVELLQSSLIQFQETGSEITVHLSSNEFNQMELEKIEERIQYLETLKRKYGGSLEAVIEYRNAIKNELDNLKGNRYSEENLVQKIDDLQNQYSSLAIRLNTVRKSNSVSLATKIEQTMKNLNMPDARFEIRVTQIPDKNGFVFIDNQSVEARENGSDIVEFYLSANPGESVKPLVSIASGGEVSRIMLAIKSVFQKFDPVQTMIFDEIDAGISGKAAESVANELVNLSNSKQVICITHLSQIAGKADHHLHISKSSKNGKTKVHAEYLAPKERHQIIKNLFIGTEFVDL